MSIRVTTPRAFSLIEVLIAIVVLALGLLGLAAVFPAVILQQQSTTGSVVGASLENSVESELISNAIYNKATSVSPGVAVTDANLRGWMSLVGADGWSMPLAFAASLSPEERIFDGAWNIPTVAGTSPGLALSRVPTERGMILVQSPVVTGILGSTPGFWIDSSDRAFRSNGQVYVWDFAARRIGAGRPYVPTTAQELNKRTLQDDNIELAVFIRRADIPRRNPQGPVSLIAVNPATQGTPSFNGEGDYSTINEATYSVPDVNVPNIITLEFRRQNDPLKPFVVQANQKFVTQWGTVHTVVEVKAFAAGTVEIKPPLAVGSVEKFSNVGPLTFLYTPQIPVSVSVHTIEPLRR